MSCGPSDDRISRLSAAILRISQSLDVATVLEEVVESARALTGARSGVITTIDEQGEVQDFVTSGLSPEEYRKMVEWSDGRRLFEHLRDQAKPLRVADLPGYLDLLGLGENGVFVDRIWRDASEALARAESLEVWRYSLPASDGAIRALLQTVAVRVRREELDVVVHDPLQDVLDRWIELLGDGNQVRQESCDDP